MSRITSEIQALSPLPPQVPKRYRISVWFVRFVLYHNRLVGMMPFVAIWWGIWTLALPEFWPSWGAYHKLMIVTDGHVELISWLMMLAGLLGYLGSLRKWVTIRKLVFLSSFALWSLLTVVSFQSTPIFSPGVAIYSALALAKLISYVNFQMGLQSDAEIEDVH